jgi:hypothetical protein
VSDHCGIGFNYAGFYPCAVAGAIDRIFGLDEAIPDLADVSEATMMEKYQVFCRLCGYYRPIRENSQTLLSSTWRLALDHCWARQGDCAIDTTVPDATVIVALTGTPVDAIATNIASSEVQVSPVLVAPQQPIRPMMLRPGAMPMMASGPMMMAGPTMDQGQQ